MIFSALLIDVLPSDRGVYTILVKNDAGTDSVEFAIDIQGICRLFCPFLSSCQSCGLSACSVYIICLSVYLVVCLSVCPSVRRSVSRYVGIAPYFFNHNFHFHLSFLHSSSNCGHVLNPEQYNSSLELEYIILRYPETRTQSTANYCRGHGNPVAHLAAPGR